MKVLNGKVAVVTGAASGIGKAMAARFAQEGMKVVLADIEEAALSATCAELSNSGGAFTAKVTDVSDPSSVEALANAAVERFGAVHVVCNNAGVGGVRGQAWDIPESAWDWILGVNLQGVINGVRSFTPLLLRQDEGHVVNTTSIAGFSGGFGSASYTTSKFAVAGLSEALRAEFAHLGSKVKVSLLCPGRINTNIERADRNWPERLGEQPAWRVDDRLGPFPIPDIMRPMMDAAMPAALVADMVVAGIKAERFWIFTHPNEVQALLRQRLEEMESESELSRATPLQAS